MATHLHVISITIVLFSTSDGAYQQEMQGFPKLCLVGDGCFPPQQPTKL